MFRTLLGRKFSKKIKHLVKCINCGKDAVRKKKQAMVRYLRKDVADLLAGGHESNAFRRLHSHLKSGEQGGRSYVPHVTTYNVWRADMILMLVCLQSHWILLVGRHQNRRWVLYDSLLNPMRREKMKQPVAVLRDININWFKKQSSYRRNILTGTRVELRCWQS